jgi:hypothetical protein
MKTKEQDRDISDGGRNRKKNNRDKKRRLGRLYNGPKEKNVGLWWKSNGNESRVGGGETEVGASSKEKYR